MVAVAGEDAGFGIGENEAFVQDRCAIGACHAGFQCVDFGCYRGCQGDVCFQIGDACSDGPWAMCVTCPQTQYLFGIILGGDVGHFGLADHPFQSKFVVTDAVLPFEIGAVGVGDGVHLVDRVHRSGHGLRKGHVAHVGGHEHGRHDTPDFQIHRCVDVPAEIGPFEFGFLAALVVLLGDQLHDAFDRSHRVDGGLDG